MSPTLKFMQRVGMYGQGEGDYGDEYEDDERNDGLNALVRSAFSQLIELAMGDRFQQGH